MVSYQYKTIGSYSPVKLQRYQDMIDNHISTEMSKLIKDINAVALQAASVADIKEILGYYSVLSMLNTKYIIINGNASPFRYSRTLGNAWFVSGSVTARNADEKIHIWLS